MTDVLDWGSLLSVTIGGSDRTTDLIGAGSVDRELDAAGIVTIRLARGSAKPSVGEAVTVAGIVATPYVGEVSAVIYDPPSRAWVVSCTDGLQAMFEALGSGAAVAAVLPSGAIWHQDLHGPFSDGWSACQDAMGTIPYSLYIESGVPCAVAWAGSGYTSTISHASGGIYDGSVGLSEATTRDLIRQITATVEIRYSRLHHWAISVGWAMPDWDFCTWAALPCHLPTRQMISDAMSQNAWTVQGAGWQAAPPTGGGGGTTGWENSPEAGVGVSTEGLPTSGAQCGTLWSMLGGFTDTGFIWINKQAGTLADMCWKGSCVLGRRWAQSLVETYTITVSATTGTSGAVLADERASHDAKNDDAAWDASVARLPPAGEGWTVSGPHIWSDVLDGANRDTVLAGMSQMMATRIRRSQRKTTLTVGVEPATEPALGSRCRIMAEDIEAEGQVIALVTTWDSANGAARCQVTIAVTGGSTIGDVLPAPSGPSMAPADAGYTLIADLTLGAHIGHVTGCGPQDKTWDGWVTNRPPGVGFDPVAGTPTYTEGFVVTTPDVPDAARNDQTGSVSVTRTIDPLAGSFTIL